MLRRKTVAHHFESLERAFIQEDGVALVVVRRDVSFGLGLGHGRECEADGWWMVDEGEWKGEWAM